MADGEVEKDFPFEVLWTKSKISAVSEEYFKKDILSWLDAQRLLINQDDRLKITDSGINSVSDFWDIPPNTLGILSREELKKVFSFVNRVVIRCPNISNIPMINRKKYFLL